MRYPRIERCTDGVAYSKHGIKTKHLLPYQLEILNNAYIKDKSKDDQFLYILFKIAYDETKYKVERIIVNPFDSTLIPLANLKEASLLMDWNCAICHTDIQSVALNFNRTNFLCKECTPTHSKSIVDERIVDSSKKFREYCQHTLEWDRRYFLRYIQNN